MEIRRYRDRDRAASIAMALARLPHEEQHSLDDMLDNPTATVDPNLVAVGDGGAVCGWSVLLHRQGLPETMRLAAVVVSQDAEGAGVGSALHAALMTGLPDGVDLLRCNVMDDDARSLAVAEHWGFQRFEHGITSRFELIDLPQPQLWPGLELESCPELRFHDSDAVMAMLDKAETNPERASGLFLTPDMLRDFSRSGVRVGRLARVDGVPVGLIHGAVHDRQLDINYACVHPDFRGKGVALAMKQQLHLDGQAAGASTLLTTNEAANTAIRSLNAKLGYRRTHGEYRLERRLSESS